jgi:hypothetical protein
VRNTIVRNSRVEGKAKKRSRCLYFLILPFYALVLPPLQRSDFRSTALDYVYKICRIYLLSKCFRLFLYKFISCLSIFYLPCPEQRLSHSVQVLRSQTISHFHTCRVYRFPFFTKNISSNIAPTGGHGVRRKTKKQLAVLCELAGARGFFFSSNTRRCPCPLVA